MIKKYKFGEVSNEEIFARFEPTSSVEDIVSDILNPVRERALTKATLETVAIIAYKQPITKLEIEEIRNCPSK